MLIWISDYFELSCWNSFSSFSDMFEDMKLFIIELLMRKWVYCELCSKCWIVLCCCWFVEEFMFNWCCCCYEILLLMIHNLGVHNHGFVMWFKLLLMVFVEMGWFGELCEMTFVFMFNVFFKALLSSWTCKQSLETYLGVGKSKLGILGEKG